jgi:hypothetical protein
VAETKLKAILQRRGFRASPNGAAAFERDGVVIEAKGSLGGVRDLRASILQLAEYASRPSVREAWLLAAAHRMPGSIRQAWLSALHALRPVIAKKLRLVAVNGDVVTTVPEDPTLLELGREIARLDRHHRPAKPYDAYFDVLHVLLVRWLLNHGPIQMSELGATTGLSQPTIRAAVQRLGSEVTKDSRRRVELNAFPRRSWGEMVALAARIRESQLFADTSGQPRPVEKLVERLSKRSPAGVALGGVLAARHWDPELDLEGVPRLDLCVHAPQAPPGLSFVKQMDPALRPVDSTSPASVAVHVVRRKTSLFDASGPERLPWADPVDTLLDLEELRLHAQAGELIRRLRARGARTP